MSGASDALAIAARLQRDVLAPIKAAFVGKDEVVDVLGVGLCAGEHAFLLGPPGTAKSALVQALAQRLAGRAFTYLLTRFTEPSELFGPFDIRRLRDGELVTNTDGMLPEAELVFLDELLNANSAILNSLLTVLNERVFRRGRETRRMPLLMAIGASNHLPEDDALAALFDRFLLRVRCDNVPDDRLGDVLRAGWRLETADRDAHSSITADDLRTLGDALPRVDLAPLREDLTALVHRLRHAGFHISDRRAVKLQRLCAASALASGRLSAHRSDLWVIRHVWDTEEQREVLQSIVADAIGASSDATDVRVHPAARDARAPDPEELARDLAQLERQLDGEVDGAVLARTADQLRALAGRCAWVADDRARAFLEQRIESLWTRHRERG